MDKKGFLSREVRHIDITELDVVDLVDAMGETAFQARNLKAAAGILDMPLPSIVGGQHKFNPFLRILNFIHKTIIQPLYEAYQNYDGPEMGDRSSKDFVLRHVFSLDSVPLYELLYSETGTGQLEQVL